MYPGKKQRFVGIDVPQTTEKGLVQEQRLNRAAVARQARMELVEAHRQWIRTQPHHRGRHLGGVLDAAKLPGVVVYEHPGIQF